MLTSSISRFSMRSSTTQLVARTATTFRAATGYYPNPVSQGVDVFLGNLDPALTAFKLKEAITKRFPGEFTGPRIVFDREAKKSLGYGYLTVPTQEIAESVVEALKGLELHNRVIKPDVAQEKRILRAAYVGNLAHDITEEEVLELFVSRYGAENVIKVRLPKDNEGRVKGFGHVEFVTSALRETAIAEMNGYELKGRPIRVDKAVLKSRLPVICINNISFDVTKQHLEEMFDDLVGHENYADVKLHYDRVTGYPRGFAHVTFISRRYAEKALEELKGIEMMGRPVRAQMVVRVNKKAQQQQQQQQQLQQQSGESGNNDSNNKS